MYSTLIAKVASGAEARSLQWSVTRRTWDIAHNVKTPAQMQELLAFFHCRMGKARTFLLYDWLDNAVYTVRFDTDYAELTTDDNGIRSWPKIPIIESINE